MSFQPNPLNIKTSRRHLHQGREQHGFENAISHIQFTITPQHLNQGKLKVIAKKDKQSYGPTMC